MQDTLTTLEQCKGAKIDCSNLTMIQVDIIQMDDYPTDSCAISPTAFLLFNRLMHFT